MTGSAQPPTMTSSWTYPPTSPGLWFNTTDASQDGAVLVGGSFQFDTTANFGFYVLDQAGQMLQSDVWDSAYEGVFWVKLNAGGTIAAGGGWLTSTYTGQLRAISVSDGSVLLSQPTGSRVNTIAMSTDGTILAAGCGATYSGSGQQIYLYSLQSGAYQALTGLTSSNNSVQSLAMSADGQWLVAGFYPNGSAPALILFQVTSTGLVQSQTWSIPSSSAMAEPEEADVRGFVKEHFAALASRDIKAESSSGGAYVKSVAMSADGTKFAAAISGANGIYYFDRDTFIQSGAAQWQYMQPGISTSSCVGMSSDGTFVVGLSNSSAPLVGYAYRVNDGGSSGTLAWSTDVEYWPNPSNHILGGEDALVSFGTGEPKKGGGLTPGHYYVLDASNGGGLGIFDTSAMNWPFQLSGDGGFAIGGSDDGYLYGFSANGNWGHAT